MMAPQSRIDFNSNAPFTSKDIAMKTTFCAIACFASLLVAAFLATPASRSADDDPKAAVLAATRRLSEQPSYGWQTTIQAGNGPVRGFRAPGFIGGDPTTGQYE